MWFNSCDRAKSAKPKTQGVGRQQISINLNIARCIYAVIMIEIQFCVSENNRSNNTEQRSLAENYNRMNNNKNINENTTNTTSTPAIERKVYLGVTIAVTV